MIKFNLKKVMKQKNINISQLNEMTGISRNSLSLLINGKSQGIQFETMEKITKALNINIEDLFDDSFDYIAIDVRNKVSIKGHFPSIVSDEKIYTIGKNVELINDNDYSTPSFSALNCYYLEDNINKHAYIPYRIFIDITGSNRIFIDINIKRSQLSNEFKRIVNVDYHEHSIRKIIQYFFTNKILKFEKELLNRYLNYHEYPILKVNVCVYINDDEKIGNRPVRTFFDLNEDLLPISDEYLAGFLENLNKDSTYTYNYEETLTIKSKNIK
ncbi:helix-turn-helix transcriptional regulator [Staphylococcus saprophyticus]|nr:helix-turn-helix transcriptional regulator [Staphylococcus saprophyticus]